MWAWLAGTPIFVIVMLFALAWLERSLVGHEQAPAPPQPREPGPG